MEKPLRKKDRLLIAGGSGLAGNVILKSFQKAGYDQKDFGGEILKSIRKEIDYLDSDKIKEWLKIKSPDIVLVAAGKVGGIYANMTYPAKGLKEEIENNKK